MHDKIKEILAKQMGKDVADIADDAEIINDLGADSLDVVEMLMSIEDEFGVNVPDEDVAKLKTVSDIVSYVEANKA